MEVRETGGRGNVEGKQGKKKGKSEEQKGCRRKGGAKSRSGRDIGKDVKGGKG